MFSKGPERLLARYAGSSSASLPTALAKALVRPTRPILFTQISDISRVVELTDHNPVVANGRSDLATRYARFEMKRPVNPKTDDRPYHFNVARPERFELPTTWFVARYSIQLSYGRVAQI